MTRLHPAWLAEQQRRWLRPDAHLYWRPDAARFLPAHVHHLLPPELRPSPQDGYDRSRPNIAAWTGKRGRWTPERAARERAEQECQAALERHEATAERLALCELKSAIAKLRSDLAFERFKRAAVRWAIAQHLLRKAGFRPDQPRWPAGSGRISGRWSGGAGTGGPADDNAAARVRLASADQPGRGRAVRNAILLQAAKRVIEAYRSDRGLWDLFRGRVGTVTVTTLNGENIFGSNSTSPTYSGIDFREATELRDRYLGTRPDLAGRGGSGLKPNDGFYHAETTLLLRAARANGGTLAGQTLEVFGDTKLCNSCRAILPYIGTQLGNPTVTFVEPDGKRNTMRDGAWIKEER